MESEEWMQAIKSGDVAKLKRIRLSFFGWMQLTRDEQYLRTGLHWAVMYMFISKII